VVEYVRRSVGFEQRVALSVAVVQRGRENLVVKVLLDAADGLTPFEERLQGVELTLERNAVQVLGTVLLEAK